jgi:hypothetical protein
VGGSEGLYISDAVRLARAFDLMDRVLEGCWKRECSLLSTLLDVKERRNRRGNALLRLLTLKTDGKDGGSSSSRRQIMDGLLLGSIASPSKPGSVTSSAANLGKRELDALLHIPIQNVNILREDLEDVGRLLSESDQ